MVKSAVDVANEVVSEQQEKLATRQAAKQEAARKKKEEKEARKQRDNNIESFQKVIRPLILDFLRGGQQAKRGWL